MKAGEKIILELKKRGQASSKTLATALGVTRTYAYLLLRQLQEEGLVFRVGNTNNAIYLFTEEKQAIRKAKKKIDNIFLQLSNANINEDAIFQRIERETGIFLDSPKNVYQLVRHGFTEMVNNAIDHSRSKHIEIRCRRTETAITFLVRDFGIGIFKNVRRKFRLPGTLDAIQRILKGKATTAPKHHSGEGVFFTSKMADIFIIDSFEKRLTVNNLLPDIFISDRRSLSGTRISFSLHVTSRRNITDVFRKFTDEESGGSRFEKTHITIKLFHFGDDLPSRSEAKRVVMGLENFKVVELDFSGVKTIGQSFADEIFRVWQNRHPDIRLEPIHTNENVAFMITRAGGSLGQKRLL